MLIIRKATWISTLFSTLLLSTIAKAVILYSGDNFANLTAPDNAREDAFNAVARVCDSTGGQTSGSAVHLRGKYLLTADHVSIGSHITFDGNIFLASDNSFTPIKIGDADIKLFKLLEDPKLPEKKLYTGIEGDLYTLGTLVGWGRGRDPDISDLDSSRTNIWTWGDDSTILKRWGINRTDSSITREDPYGNTYTLIQTSLSHNAGDDEASVAIFDSGSGLFIKESGIWKLAGLTTFISSPSTPLGSSVNTSTFHRFSSISDRNYFARITTYASQIETAIPDIKTYSGWKLDHGLYDNEANNEADIDLDGIVHLIEFAFGGDPRASNRSILPVQSVVDLADSAYLQLEMTRPIGLEGITYTPQTTTKLNDWSNSSSGIDDPNPTAQDNGDGTETLIYRRSTPINGSTQAFIRIMISEVL